MDDRLTSRRLKIDSAIDHRVDCWYWVLCVDSAVLSILENACHFYFYIFRIVSII